MTSLVVILLLTLLAMASCCCGAADCVFSGGVGGICAVPATLHWTVTNVSGCACLDGATGTITYSGLGSPPFQWKSAGEDTGVACGGTEVFDCMITDCTSSGMTFCWRLAVSTNALLGNPGAPSCGSNSGPLVCTAAHNFCQGDANVTVVCSPFSLTLTGVSVGLLGGCAFPHTALCTGTINITFTA